MLSFGLAIGMLLTALATESSAAGEVALHARLSPPVIPFHRVAHYTITLESPEGLEITAPSLPEQMEGLEIRGAAPERQSLPGNRVRTVYRYTLDPVQMNTYPLPPPEAAWEGGSIIIPGLVLEVRDLSPAEREAAAHFEEIIPVGAVTPTRWNRQRLAAAAIVLAGLSLLALYLWRRYSQPEKVLPPPPPWEVARQRLRELNRRQLPSAGRYEAYYVDLSAILRYYIEDRFALHAPEQTTPEFIEEASNTGLFSELQEQRVSAFLRHCDYVKFAQYRPSLEEMERSYQFVHWFVGDTIPRSEAAAPEAVKEESPAPEYVPEPGSESPSETEEALR